MLRASLRYFNVDNEMRTVLVTSYGAEVGKSTVAWNLARVGATGSRTVIVETDLRNPTLARQHGLNSAPGPLGGADAADRARRGGPVQAGRRRRRRQRRRSRCAFNARDHRRLAPPNPAELLESEAMAELLAELRERYTLVVVDTAPLGVVSDCFPLAATGRRGGRRRADGPEHARLGGPGCANSSRTSTPPPSASSPTG